MPPKPRIRLFCSVSGIALRRETQVDRFGREQNCKCHGKQVMAGCVTCGLVKYHDCSAHAKRSGHQIVQMDDPFMEFNDATSSPDTSIFCFIIDSANQKYLFSEPCPFIAINKDVHTSKEVREGDVILLVKNDKVLYATRLMEREHELEHLSLYNGGNMYACYYIQTPSRLVESLTIDEAVHKWSTMKDDIKVAGVVNAKKKLLDYVLEGLE